MDFLKTLSISKIVMLLVLVTIGVILYFTCIQTTNEPLVNDVENKSDKVLNYYGGHFCPHSRVGSSMHNLIGSIFQEKYPNVVIKYYWSGENDEEFVQANIEYVPTVTNSYNQQVFVGLPEGTITEGKSDDELQELLLSNIYNQL